MNINKIHRKTAVSLARASVLLAAIVGFADAAHAEGSRNMYPASCPAAGYRAAMDLRYSNTYAGIVRQGQFLYVYAKKDEYILLGSSNRMSSGGGQILVYNPQSFGSRGDETIPGTSDFSCDAATPPPGSYAGSSLGIIASRPSELAGPNSADNTVTVANGFAPCAYKAPVTGIYGVKFTPATSGGRPDGKITPLALSTNAVDAWDVTVRANASTTTNINGRVFTYALPADTGNNNRPVYHTLYYVTPDGLRYRQDMTGLDPNSYALWGSNFGFLDNGQPLYKDIRGDGNLVNTGKFFGAPGSGQELTADRPSAPIFFSSVDPGAPDAAEINTVLTALGIPLTSQAPQITNPQFNGLSGGNVTFLGGGGTFTFNSTDTTSYQIVISADGIDFDPAKTTNATLTGTASNGLNTVNWNGRNNANTDFPTGSFSYKVVGRNGEIHFPIVDTEGNKNGGPQLTRLNGLSAPDTTIFYDDRGYLTRDGNAVGQLNGKLCGASSTQTQPAPVYSLLGVDSSDTNLGGSGHAYRYWPGYGNSQSDCSNSSGFGDAKGLDLWVFQQTPVETGTVQIDPQPAQATVSTAVSVPPTANPGATVNGSFSYSNVSSVNATSVQYGATIGTPGNCPTNLAFSSLPSGASWTYNSSTCVVSLSGMPSTLIAGADLDFNFSYTAPGSGSIPVDTTISAGNDPAHPVASPATAHGETVVNSADIAVTKTVDNATPVFGATVTFTVTVTNNGPDDASNVTVNDTLPSGYTLSNATPSKGSFASGVWTVGGLANGASETLTLEVVVNASGGYLNSATAGADQYDPDNGNNTDSASTTPSASADIAVTKTVDNATPAVGSNVTFTITTTNNGPSDATGVSVSDTLPSGYSYVSDNGGGAYNSGTGVWTIGNLANGASASLTITAKVLASGNYTNTATGSATETDPVPGNNSDSAGTTPSASADIAVTKTVDNATPAVGSNVTFTITTTNNGPSDATGVSVSDTLPSGYSYVSDNGGGAYNSGTGVWTIGNLANGASASLTITAKVLASGNYTNTATGSATETDPVPGNNSDSASTTPSASADIAVTKTVDNATPTVGSNVTFTITTTNNGPSAATGVSVSDTLPSGYSYVSDNGGGAYSSGTGVWTIGNLANGASASLTITAKVLASGNYTNTATGSATETDPVPGNNSDSAGTTPSASADIAVTKTVDNATPAVGSNVTFTITTTNNGPSDATGVSVSDTLPSGYSYVSDNGGGAYNSGTGVWTIGNLTNGASASLTITAKVLASGNYTNTATGSATETDPVPGNNSDSAGTTPTPSADLSITKTDGSATYTPGSTISYTIVASNAGPSDVTGATVSDTVPAAITGATWTCVASTGASCTASGSGNISDTVNIPNGGNVTYTLTGTVKSDTTGNLVNTATVAAPAGTTDPDGDNNSATDTDTASASADLSITKTDGSATYTPGSTISYTIVAGNAGPSDVTGATVSDTVPAAITGATWTCVASTGASCTASGSGNISDTVNIPNGGNVTYTLTGTVKSDTTGNLVNTATVAAPAGTTDPDGGNNSATDTDTLDAQADLVVTKTGSASVVPGNNVVYTITVKNNGPSDAAALSLADPAPAGLSFVSADAPCSGGFPCSLGTMASGSTVTVANVTFSVPSGYSGPGPIVNTATATSATPDPDTGNNSDSASTTLASGEADLEVVKTGPASVTAGGSISWTVVVTNHGPSDADGASFSDPVPSGVTAVSAACGAETGSAVCGSVSVASNTVSSTITTLPAGGSVSFTISGTAPMTNIQLSNTAYVAPPSDVSDPDGSDNSSSSDTNVGIAGTAIEVPVDSRWLLILLSGLLLLTGLGFRRRYSR